MRDFAGKVAFITGGASGIGLALGHAFAKAGCCVMLADIEERALRDALRNLEPIGPDIRGIVCDVADPASVGCAIEETIAAFGKLHILCNNAGVAGGSGIDDISLATWRWVLDVNLLGVVHGIHAGLPHLRAQGEGGHIVNTASMAGLLSDGGLGFSPYNASKYAVVAMSEGLQAELRPHGIGVTVVCPGFVRTRISDSGRNRPERYGPAIASPRAAAVAELVEAGIDPKTVADQVLAAIRNDQLYVLTHPQFRAAVEQRFADILAAFAKQEGIGR
jgi:NAD(P)-dependent dehydrogenase (short-subunit alcohol dehydrogenase family)